MKYIVIRTSNKSGKIKLCTFAEYGADVKSGNKQDAEVLVEQLCSQYGHKYSYQAVEIK